MTPLDRLAVRQVRRGGIAVLAVAAGMSVTVAAQYGTTFAGALDGPALAALAADPAIRVLFGPARALDDPGGFTVWRTGTPVAVLVGVWALLTATRTTRGDEAAGRWDLVLGGRVRTVDLVARQLVALWAALVLVGAAVAAALAAVGTAATGAVLHGAGIAGVGLVFAALGVLAAQVLPTRAAATGTAAGVLGAGLLVRMAADGVGALAWLRWSTPFGVLGEVQPYAADRPGPLLLLAAGALVPAGLALVAAARRDVGGGLLVLSAGRPPRRALLGSPGAFALRRAMRPLTGWTVGVTAYFLLVGALAPAVTGFLLGNPRFAELAAAAGFPGLGGLAGYTATMASLLAVPVGLWTAAWLAAASADEASGRAVPLFSLPVPRAGLALAEAGVAMAGAALLLTVAGLAFWAGAAGAGAPLEPGDALMGAWNVAPVPLLCVGAALVALGWAPRTVLAVGSLPAAGGFLLQVVAQSTGAPPWVARLSPFAHLAPVPQAAPDWTATAAMVGLAVVLAALGLVGHARRDLRG